MHHMVAEIPALCRACGSLVGGSIERDHMAIAMCVRCEHQYVRLLPGWLPVDEDLILHFSGNVDALMSTFGHSLDVALQLARDYYFKFTDSTFCKSIGVATQDDDFFWHEGNGLFLRMHYYLAMRGDPNPRKFIEWRSSARGSRTDS